MKVIKIVILGDVLGDVVPLGVIPYNVFRRAVGETWSKYWSNNNDLNIKSFVNFHNSISHIQIGLLETEILTLD